MAGDTQGTTGKPGQILVTLLLEGPATIDYRLLSERVGKFLDFNLEAVKEHKPEFPMILPADGDLIFGMDMDFAFPERLDSAAQHRSEEHTSELQSLRHLVCRLLLEKKKK